MLVFPVASWGLTLRGALGENRQNIPQSHPLKGWESGALVPTDTCSPSSAVVPWCSLLGTSGLSAQGLVGSRGFRESREAGT